MSKSGTFGYIVKGTTNIKGETAPAALLRLSKFIPMAISYNVMDVIEIRKLETPPPFCEEGYLYGLVGTYIIK